MSHSLPKKIQRAARLIESGELEKGFKAYRDVCFDGGQSTSTRSEILINLFSLHPGEGTELLIKLRDSYIFLDDRGKEDTVKILEEVGSTSSTHLPIFERMVTATFLYNRLYLKESMKVFISVASDPTNDFVFRVDACKYMFGSSVDEYQEQSSKFLVDAINDTTKDSLTRYRVIVSFSSKFGIITYINREKIKAPYDERFVYKMQTAFFRNKENGIRQRILSGQHLLQMEREVVEEAERIMVVDELLKISEDKEREENIRADAADVVLRLGTSEERGRARGIITELGYSSVRTFKTIYSNSQNMHDVSIAESVSKYIERLLVEIVPFPYDRVKEEISSTVRAIHLSKAMKFSIYQALNRIEIDTATYSTKNVTLAEVLALVWTKIRATTTGTPGPGEHGYSSDRDLMIDRLMEELSEMSDTCSSGHTGRLINVLSGISLEGVITISFKSQVMANIAGRLMAKMRGLDDEEREGVFNGMLPNADEEDYRSFIDFVDEHLPAIKEELYKEFVEEKYITSDEFTEYYESATAILKTGKIPSSIFGAEA